MEYFNGLHLNMGNISRLSKAKTRSITAENFKGEKGAGGMSTDGVSWSAAQDLGQGLEVSPCINLEANSITTLAEIEGPGAIQHILVRHPCSVLALADSEILLGWRRSAVDRSTYG